MKHLCISLLLSAGSFLLAGCATDYPALTLADAEFYAAMDATADQRPQDEDRALKVLTALFEDFSSTNLLQHTRQAYADTFYFRDGFKHYSQIDDLEAYMVHSAEPLRSCQFEFSEPIRNPPDYYLRWVMKVNLKRDDPDRVQEVIGMSHVRFNSKGKVVFQQDYWDPTDVLYRRIPIANGLIGYVRSKL